MPFRTRSFRPWLWSVAILAFFAPPAPAQPPSPLELVRGLREHGQVELALEYLKDIENKPLSADDKAAIPMERAKCLLEASEDEPDEGTRLGMVSEAKEALNGFLLKSPNHPRAVEALLAIAKLTTLDAREQLNRARRIDVPPPSDSAEERAARERAQDKQKETAKQARPLFLLAAKRYAEASDRLRTRLDDKTLDPMIRKALEREAFEADLASGINQYNTAETYMPADVLTGVEKKERNNILDQSKAVFASLAKGPNTNRTVWVARAWVAEVTYEQDDFNAAANEVAAVLKAPFLEAEDGKRLARFFQLRRNYLAALGERNLKKVMDSEQELRGWLKLYGRTRKPTPELFAVRYYLARVLQSLAETNIGPPKKGNEPVKITATPLAQLKEAELLYRALAQSDHDFTLRAGRQRMAVVRRLLGEADLPPSAYDTFEKAQMAALIQMSKLTAEEAKKSPDKKKVDAYRHAAIALLERSRELASPADNPADVTDVFLRLIFFYQLTDQPYEQAVLGEYVAHTVKGTGGKAALAGLLGLNGYVVASTRIKGDDAEIIAAARKADRARAATLARFLDEKFPNDNATDAARHRLASMLTEDKKYPEAFEIIVKVRPSYARITDVRLFEGYLAAQLINAKESPLPAARKAEVFQRAISDLAKVSRPAPIALKDEVAGYLSARCRLALLMFAQGKADPAGEATNPGYNQALAISEEVIGLIPTFDAMTTTAGGMKKLNVDGMEMSMLAQDAYTRAVYLRARALIDAGKLADADKTLEPLLTVVKTSGPVFVGPLKAWAEGRGDLLDPSKPDSEENRDPQPVAVQKAKVAQLAAAVDKTRIEAILTGFRLKVKESKPAEATELLDLMIKAGGTIEDNLPLLELLGREMAAQMGALKKEGKKVEADALGAGLAVLLKKIAAVPKLSTQMTLFLGQTFLNVGEYKKAIETLKKIPAPDFAGWETKKPEEIPAELRGKVLVQIREYSAAQLGIARALRESKDFDEAEKMLRAIIGTNEKQGWGSGRLYFRRELAQVHEGKAASIADAKQAEAEWGKALKEWKTLFGIHQNRLRNPPKDVTPPQMIEYRNAFADAFLDYYRCQVKAYQQVRAGKLQEMCDGVGKRFADMEKQIPLAEWQPEVQHHYADLLKEVPQLVAPYKANGGKLFLEKLPVQ